jgi:selenocysteine lyase/cysteine desulfurase
MIHGRKHMEGEHPMIHESAEQIARWRAETPGTAHVTHFNNAGASLMPVPVLRAVRNQLDLEATIGAYEAAAQAAEAIDGVYLSIARLLNAKPDEIALMESATRAWDMAFYGLRFAPGDRILTAQVDYVSNYLAYLQTSRRTGARVEAIPSDESGQVSVAALERMIDKRVKLISITHVPTNGGLVNPAAAIGRVARAAGIPYLLDACQAAGQMPLDVEAIGCDMLSANGRKYLRAPRGTGFLYVRSSFLDRLDPPFVESRSANWTSETEFSLKPGAGRFENFESSICARLGLGAAVDYALGIGLDRIRQRVTTLADIIRHRLAALPGVHVHDLGVERCGIVTIRCDRVDSERVQSELARRRINVSVSPREWTLVDMTRRGLEDLVRISVHYYNTEEEIDALVAAIRDLKP